MPEAVPNFNWGKFSAVGSCCALVLAGVFWVFQVNAKADEAIRIALENKGAISAALKDKADADDIQQLRQDIRDVRNLLEERKR